MATWRPLAGQLLKGDWTNNPRDDNYHNHWNSVGDLAVGEQVETVVPAQLKGGHALGPFRPTNNVNVVVTDRQVRVDTPDVERVGPLASLAGKGLDRSGLSQPLVFPREQVQIQPVADGPRVNIGLPDGRTMTGRTDLHIGSPRDLSPVGQIRNLGRMLRG
ncbi:MAG TPA: hypothetical protein VH703_02685 [Solirubrobacterales bacterium]|jgi:hypothetical protein